MDLLTVESLPEGLRNGIAYRNFAAKETLFQQGDAASAFFVVETGRVKLVRYTSGDKMVTFQVAGAGESLGEIGLFSDTYPCAAIAEAASRVIVYPKELLLSALQDNSDLAQDFIAILVTKIEALKLRLELRDIRKAHERVLQYLRYQVEGEENAIAFDRPLKDIAADLGLTPETLSRALTKLEEEGVIMRSRLVITLQNSSVA
jgi:CRP/FNR family transcriptional regulator, dissimilatory nitrate respiration regulator